jgi:uncharacterized protein (UPF0332 family)
VSALIKLGECIEKGLIRKTLPSPEQARGSLSKAKVLLQEAKAAFSAKNYNSTVMVAYAALFTAARAVLFRDGFRERSHACVARYLEEKYSDKLPPNSISFLDYYRETRHEVQYEASYLADGECASQMLVFADGFIAAIGRLMI